MAMRLTALARRGRRFLPLVRAWLALVAPLACGGGLADDGRGGALHVTGDSIGALSTAPGSAASRTLTESASPHAAEPAAPPRGFAASVGFRSRRQLEEHHARHGAEFGRISQAEYLRRAQALRDAPVGGDILELRRGDGSRSRFDRASGAFLAFDADGTIRTYFRPNDGEAYFRRQARRRGARE